MPTKIEKSVGAKIRALRKDSGLTQAQLASSISVEPETVSRYETGKVTPSLQALAAIAKALGIELGELFNGSRSSPRSTRQPELSRIVRRLERLDQLELKRVGKLLDLFLDGPAPKGKRGKKH